MAAAAEALREAKFLAESDLKEAMALEREKNEALESLRVAKAALVLHLQQFSDISVAGKLISGISKDSETLRELMAKDGRHDDQVEALESFLCKTSDIVSNLSKLCDDGCRCIDDDVLCEFTRASALYRSLSARFFKLLDRLKQCDDSDLPASTPAQIAFASEYLHSSIILDAAFHV